MAWNPLGTLEDAGNWLYGAGKDALGQVGGVASDAFTGENAQAGSYAPEDYLYGGSRTASETARRDMLAQGQQAAGQFAQGGQYSRDTSGAAVNALYGGAADAQAMGLGSAATTADLSRQAQVRATNLRNFGDAGSQQQWGNAAAQLANFQYSPVDKSSRQDWERANQNLANYQYDPTDTRSRADWAQANQQLANFQYSPSAQAQQAGDRLGGFSAGPQGTRTADTYDALRSYAAQGPGPSAAEAQLRKAQDTNVAAQVALAKSGRGAGASTQAMRDAQFGAAQIGQQTAADAANLRANEAATWRGQQLGALGQAGQLGTTTEAQRQSLAGLDLSARQAQAGYAQGADQLGTQARLSALQGAAGQQGQYAQSSEQGRAQAAQARLSALQGAAGQYGDVNQTATQGLSQAAQLRLSGLQGAAGQWGGLTGYGVQRDVASDQARQGWGGLAISGQNAAAGQQLGANQLYLGALGQGGQLQNQANATQLGYLQGGTSAQAGYNQYAYGIGENEAQRRAQLQNTRMGGITQISQANQNQDYLRDQNTMGFASKALSFIPGLGGM